MSDWAYKYTKAEDWGVGIEKLDFRLFHKVDLLVNIASKMVGGLEVKFIIHTAWAESGHSENSQHYIGKAVDGHLMFASGFPLPLEIQMIAALRAGFTGIGLYPQWRNPGLHCDVRDLLNGEEVKMWVQRLGQYVPLDEKQLRLL